MKFGKIYSYSEPPPLDATAEAENLWEEEFTQSIGNFLDGDAEDEWSDDERYYDYFSAEDYRQLPGTAIISAEYV